MKNEDFIKMNEDGWNHLIKNNAPFSNTVLPEYGPFLKRNEDELNLIDNIKNAKVLDIGCGSGGSLEYLYKKGASEIWGLDISKEQILEAQKRFPKYKDNFIISPMEEEVNIPNNYFDYVIFIFSIGYTSDLLKTLKNVNKYLNKNGSVIISWTHPFYRCLDILDAKVIINKSYFNEESEIITKGQDKVNLAQKNLMISTIINIANEAGFYVDKILEEETIVKDDVKGYKSAYWKKEKIENCPSTLIIKFKRRSSYEV